MRRNFQETSISGEPKWDVLRCQLPAWKAPVNFTFSLGVESEIDKSSPGRQGNIILNFSTENSNFLAKLKFPHGKFCFCKNAIFCWQVILTENSQQTLLISQSPNVWTPEMGGEKSRDIWQRSKATGWLFFLPTCKKDKRIVFHIQRDKISQEEANQRSLTSSGK